MARKHVWAGPPGHVKVAPGRAKKKSLVLESSQLLHERHILLGCFIQSNDRVVYLTDACSLLFDAWAMESITSPTARASTSAAD